VSDAVELEVRARCEARNFEGAISYALEHYGDELFGFLHGLARNHTQADDAFSATCERMWRGIEKFRWDCPFRVWAYRVARNEFLRTTREATRARRTVPISEIASVVQAAERVRTSHKPVYERTAVRDRFAKIRAQLDPDDHALLGLRLDRKMAWNDIAKVMAASDEEPGTAEVAALRKRFERLKAKLRDLASG